MYVRAVKDIPHVKGRIPAQTRGRVLAERSFPNVGSVLAVEWELEGAPRTTSTARPGEYEIE